MSDFLKLGVLLFLAFLAGHLFTEPLFAGAPTFLPEFFSWALVVPLTQAAVLLGLRRLGTRRPRGE
jgi:hypothetical protein